jgi:LacI family transcriptional regulator
MVDFFKLDTEIVDGAIKCRNLESLRRGAIDLLDGAAFPGCDAASINYLLRSGTPYVLYNSQVPDAHPLAFVGSDFYKSGQIAGGLCARCTDEFGEIVTIAEGVPSYAPIVQRIAGFSDSISKYYPRCKIAEKIYYACYNEEAQHNIFSFFRNHPHVSSVYIVSAADYNVCKTIRDADPAGSVRIITNDMTDIQKRFICSGIISATITQEPEMQGSLPLEILYQYLVYGKEAEKAVFYTNLDIQLPVCIG